MKKHYLVIGGSKGTGIVFAKLASIKQNVSIISRNKPSYSFNADFYRNDITDFTSTCETLRTLVKNNKKIDAIIFFQRYRGQSEEWNNEINTSLTSSKQLIDYCCEQKFINKNASIVFIGSIANHFIAEEQPLSYHVTKSAQLQMMKYYAVKLGKSLNARVNSVSPAAVVKPENKKFYQNNNALYKFLSSAIPLGRFASSADISYLILFLCSSNAKYITGQDIVIDGGLSLLAHEGLLRKIFKESNHA